MGCLRIYARYILECLFSERMLEPSSSEEEDDDVVSSS
jgi:hypothetical protein